MGVDVNAGASQIAQLLQQGQSEPETVTQPSDSEPEQETAEQPETVEDTVETTESEHHEPESEYEETEETPESDTDLEPTYKVKVNGEEREVSVEDLRKGYMMESDYRKKTSEVARQREEFLKEKESFNAKLAQAEELLIVEAEDLNSPENLELKEYDPKEYYSKRDKLEAKARRLQELKQESLKTQQERNAQRLEKEKELLFQAIPEWLDDNVLTQETQMVNDFLTSSGIEGNDLQPFVDHRLLVMARKAAMYDKLKAAKPESKKVQPKPKNAKAGNVKTNEEVAKSKVDERRTKLRKTGKMSDAASAIKSILR